MPYYQSIYQSIKLQNNNTRKEDVMNRIVFKYFVIVCLFIGTLFIANQVLAVDVHEYLDKKDNLTQEELIEGAKKEGKLVFYSAHGLSVNQHLLKRFSEAYPFVKTDLVRAGGLIIGQRFYAEKSRKVENMDTLFSGAAELYPDWKKKGYIARVDNLPEWKNIIELAKGEGSRYVSFTFMTHVLAWNRKQYKDEEVPSDLWEFTKPEWKNKTASGDPAAAGFALNWFSFASDARPKDPRSPHKSTGLGYKWMEAMHKNGHLLAGQIGNLTDTIVSGRRPIVVQHWDQEIWYANKHGADLGSRYPIQGSIAQHSLIIVNSKSPHPYTARLFVNWLLSKEGQTVLVKELGYNFVRKDMKTSDFIEGRMPIEKCWILDIEKITSEETRDFIRKVNDALRGIKK
jgi:iron(III) transport system substrate-binding protein